MRTAGQNIVSKGRLLAWDAAGENPILLIDFSTNVSNAAIGSRVLAATANFAAYTDPPVEADFVLAAPIPLDYLVAGSLTFENDDGTLLVWRLSWGGAGYTGNTTGALTNDDDQEFGPPFAGPLPSDGLQGLLFQGDAQAKSSSNAADYALRAGAAVFTNNAGLTFTVVALSCPNDPDNDDDHDGVCGDVDNCPRQANTDQADADGDGVGDVCDGCPQDADKVAAGVCGCGVADTDSDADGLLDCQDNCPQNANPDQADRDGDGVGNACDGCPDNPDISDLDAPDCGTTGGPPPDDGAVNDNTTGGSTVPPGADGGSNGENGGTTGPKPRACGIGMMGLMPLFLAWSIVRAVRRRA